MRNNSAKSRLFSVQAAITLLVALAVIFFSPAAFGQVKPDSVKTEKKKHWFELLSIRGYTQLRYHGLLATNEDLKCEQCDKNWNSNGGFSLRRARLILFGDITDRVYIYIQADMANTVGSSIHFFQIRDLYADIALDKKKEFRFRVGQSKVPYGFENLQSSQNRLPLDRADATNSACPNERDLGVFFMWAPKVKRDLYRDLVRDGLKGSGDYGSFAIGIYNGQTTNKPELNNSPYAVARMSWPFKVGKQIFEPSVHALSGKYTLASDQKSAGVKAADEYLEQRVGASVSWYPQPFGIQAEYNIGKGPRFNNLSDSIEVSPLRGGYVMGMYRITKGKHTIIPFYRYQFYDGGKKQELDARSYFVNENEIGIEWSPFPALEVVAMYVISSRRFEDFAKQDNFQSGRLLRLQLQVNY